MKTNKLNKPEINENAVYTYFGFVTVEPHEIKLELQSEYYYPETVELIKIFISS